MGKIFLGVLLLLLWLWIGPKDVSWPDFGWETISQEIEKKTNDVAGDETGIASSTTALVRYVIDGDMFDIEAGERVRLLGVDTPERGECYYEEATDFVRTMIHGKEVRMTSDETDKDKYDRLLRHVYVTVENDDSEKHLNLNLVEEGYAKILQIPPDRMYWEEFAAAEAAAKVERRGLWGACEGG